MKRSTGILMPISALPGGSGIGTLGRKARAFADFLKEAGVSCWQILPAGPTSYGDSPYQCFSTFAGNPYFIDPDQLVERGLLWREEIPVPPAGGRIDYAFLYETRFRMLGAAAKRAYASEEKAIRDFLEKEEWLDPYARFMAIKKANGMRALQEWTVTEFDASMQEDYDLHVYIQYEFFRQWNRWKDYVNSLGIRIIGDVPIYVSADSADVRSNPKLFRVGENFRPEVVSGVPPDYFSEDGQLWGNPLYDYDKMKEDGFAWWIQRIGQAARLYDVIRIDHFRGFSSYWSVPAKEKTAKNGSWNKGPGMELVGRLTQWYSDTDFIAEDLGEMTPDVPVLLEKSGLPGMRVLQFAFDGDPMNPHLPHNYDRHGVCYTGTHDNPTLAEWIADNKTEAGRARQYFGVKNEEELQGAMLRAGMASVCELFVAPVQDWLGLGAEARINTPGTALGNWTWRLPEGLLTSRLAEEIHALTERYGRLTSDAGIDKINY